MWIPIDQSLIRHPKLKKMSRLLQISQKEAIGYLVSFWMWCVEYAQDGDITKYDADDISDGCDWEGNSGEFYNALLASRFIIETEDNELIVNDWNEYAGKCFENKEKSAEKMRKFREKQKSDITLPLRDSNVTDTLPLRDGIRLDKIRIDKNNILCSKKDLESEFEELWKEYPKKEGKVKSLNFYQKYRKEYTKEQFSTAILNYKRKIEKEKTGEKYILLGSSFFNGRFIDYVNCAAPAPAAASSGGTPGNGKKKQQWVIDVEEDPFLTPEQKEVILSGQ